MKLIGRGEEIELIREAIRRANEGEAEALALVGEAGIGKSALLAAAAESAEAAGMQVLIGRAAEHEREVPYALTIDALDERVAAMNPARVASVGPEPGSVLPAAAEEGVAPPGSGPAERFRHHRALGALIELLGRERPLALLLDDLHWADEASTELVLHLLRRPPQVGFLLVLAMRPGPEAQRLLDAGRRHAAWTELQPKRLGPEDALAMLPEDLGPARREEIVRSAAGNPLFIEELARAPVSGSAVPETVAAVVRAELEGLGDEARALAEGAAIAGDPFDLDVAAAAAGLGVEAPVALDALVAADLVRGGEGRSGFRFRHPLVRQAIADATPPGRRLEAHERAAGVLAARGAAPGLRAHHVEQFAQPGDEEAIELLAQAARSSRETAPALAARWYAAALGLLPHDARDRRADLLAPMAAALASAGRLGASRDAIDEWIALLGEERPEEWAERTAMAAIVEVLMGEFEAADRRVAAALESAPTPQRSRLLLQRAGAAFFQGEPEAVLMCAERAEQELGDAGPAALRASAAAQRGVGLVLIGEDGEDALEAAAHLLEAADDEELTAFVDADWTVGGSLGQVERFGAAVTVLERGLRLARASRQEHLLQHFHVLIALFGLPLLTLDSAAEHAQAAVEIARLQSRDYDLAFALSVEARALRARGDSVAAERAAAESDDILGGDHAAGVTRSILVHNAIVRLGPDPERLLAELERIAGLGLEGLNRLARAAPALAAVRAATSLDRFEEAERYVEVAAAAAAGLPVSAVRAQLATQELALARGDAAPVAVCAADIAAQAAAIEARQEELAARLLQGRALRSSGQQEAAVEVLRALADDAGQIGALADHHAAVRELRQAGIRVASGPRRKSGEQELTEREREIAELVARGHTNKEVAATLFISEKTVERHLSSVYARLGIRSRVELARVLPAPPSAS